MKKESDKVIKKLYKSFQVSSVCREDLLSQGYDRKQVLALDDSDMQHIADKMGESFCDMGYWEALDVMAEDYKLKKQQK